MDFYKKKKFQFNRLVSYANEDEEEDGEDLDRDSDEHEPDESKSFVKVICRNTLKLQEVPECPVGHLIQSPGLT